MNKGMGKSPQHNLAYAYEKEREEVEASGSDSGDDEESSFLGDMDIVGDDTPRKQRSGSRRTGLAYRKGGNLHPKRKLAISDESIGMDLSSSTSDESPTKRPKHNNTMVSSIDLCGEDDDVNEIIKKTATMMKKNTNTNKKNKKETPTKQQQQQQQQPVTVYEKENGYYVSRAAFYDRSPREIVEHLNHMLSEIMYQDSAIEELIFRIYARVMTPLRDINPSNRIFSMHLTGNSGIGKTKSAELLALALGIGPGTPYPLSYHHVNLSKYSDQSHAVAITGAASGLVGYNDDNLVTTLIKIAKEAAPFIVLHLDEACKAHAAFINGMNPLLSEGMFANVKEQRFVVPEATILIILWTSNFAEGIDKPIENPERATKHVFALMREKGYDHCDIGRMGGDPIFYKPLSIDEMYGIIEKKGNSRLPLHPFSREFGVPTYRSDDSEKKMTMDADTNIFIRNILRTYKPELGVRHPLEKYKSELDALLTVADLMAKIGGTPSNKKRKKRTHPPIYWCRQIEITAEDRANREEFLASYPEIATALHQRRKNRMHFNRIFDDVTQPMLEYIVLKFYKDGFKMLAYSILQPVSDQSIRAEDDIVTTKTTQAIEQQASHTKEGVYHASVDTANADYDETEIENALAMLKLQNQVLTTKFETLSRECKTMKLQLDVVYANQKRDQRRIVTTPADNNMI